jgi:hypothetical protein
MVAAETTSELLKIDLLAVWLTRRSLGNRFNSRLNSRAVYKQGTVSGKRQLIGPSPFPVRSKAAKLLRRAPTSNNKRQNRALNEEFNDPKPSRREAFR